MISAQCEKCKKFSESMTYHQCPYCGYRDDTITGREFMTILAMLVAFGAVLYALMSIVI